MYYYGSRDKMHVSTFLNEVHTFQEAKYKLAASPMKAQAMELQDFFQRLKQYAQAKKDGENIIEDTVFEHLLNSIESFTPGNYRIYNLFGKRGGARFERELDRVIRAVIAQVAQDPQVKLPNLILGAERGNVMDMTIENFMDESVQQILREVGTKTQKKFKDDAGNVSKALYYLADVDGKIDVQGYSVQVNAKADPYLLRIYSLLQEATFSAKNYDSMSWDNKLKVLKEVAGKNLHLGNSNLYRAIYGVLHSAGIVDNKTIASAFFAGRNEVNKGDATVAAHFYHIRYIYELAGTGITYGDKDYGEVKYLIYNDPNGNIYVKSVAEILVDVLEQKTFLGNPFQGGIYYATSNFK